MCIVEGGRLWYIRYLAEPSLVLIEEKVPSHISIVRHPVLSENKFRPDLGRGYYCSYARDLISLSSPIGGFLPYQSNSLQYLYQRKRTLFSFFPAYNLYFHLTIVIASGISIIFSINFKRIEIFILLYTSISKVSHYLLLSGLHPTQTSE